MSPRPRKPRNTSLPPNLYTVNGGKQYRYKHPGTGKFHGMGSDKLEAIRAAKQLNALLVADSDLVTRVSCGETLKAHIDWFWKSIIPEREYRPATLKMYRTGTKKLIDAMGDKSVSDITVHDMSGLMEKQKSSAGNRLRQVAVDVFKVAQARGLIDSNPADVTLKRKEKKRRKRLTLEWYAAIRAQAAPWMQNAMDIGLLTLQRREDVAKMRFDNIKDGFLYVIQEKTQKYDTGYIRIKISPQLDQIIKRCRDNIPSPYLVHRKPIKRKPSRVDADHWTQVLPAAITKEFAKARDLTGLFDGWDIGEQPTFHEIRALGIKLYRDAGKDPQSLAGHSSTRMTNNYDSGHDDIRWNEAEADLEIAGL